MKKNAQKILLCLYPTHGNQQLVMPSSRLRLAVPDMSASGYRSLVTYLEQKHLLSRETLAAETCLSITETGRRALIAKFPALNPSWRDWDGKWQALVCIQAPQSDPNFRYLRQKLLSEYALPLTRGVYLGAGGFSAEVLTELNQLYQESVVIFSVGEWQLGMDRPIIVNYYDLASIASIYSGISKSTEQLLADSGGKKKRSDQQKRHISTSVDRLWSGLREDPGFTAFYFPGVLDAPSLLNQVQQVLLL